MGYSIKFRSGVVHRHTLVREAECITLVICRRGGEVAAAAPTRCLSRSSYDCVSGLYAIALIRFYFRIYDVFAGCAG